MKVLISVFCVFVLISGEEYNEKINEAFCKLDCYDEVISDNECDCNNGSRALSISNYNQKYANNDLRLKCTSENLFHIEWNDIRNPEANRSVYFLYVENIHEFFFTEIVFTTYYTHENALSNTVYNVTLWTIDNGNNVFVSKPLSFQTSSPNVAPLPVTNISITLKPNEGKYEGMVNWIPAKDRSCFYEVVLYCTNMQNRYDTVPAPEIYDITDIEELFNLNIEELNFGNRYALTIRARTGEYDNESTNNTIYFEVPTCLETYKNITICEPEQPKNVSITEKLVDEETHLYNIELNWLKPNFTPDYYLARLNVINKNLSVMNIPQLNISGDSINAIFESVELSSYYQVILTAFSAGGQSFPAIIDRLSVHSLHIPKIPESNWHLITIIVTIVGVIILGLLIIPIRRIMFKKEKLNEITSYNKNYVTGEEYNEDNNQNFEKSTITDEWEISMENLKFQTVLGEGAFGIVWQASLKNKFVACKTLKDNSSLDEKRQLQQEIEIMKSVGSHPNIVSIVGCVTQNVNNGPILIVEYCSMGDLLSFLRTIFNNMAQCLNKSQYQNQSNNNFTNQLYELGVNGDEQEFSINHIDVISFARQIAMGMEYLSLQKVLHRDLAARNILMCEGKKLKVSDFGLSRDVYMDSVYCKTTNGKLPVRWMALESLTHQIYTTQSDVWSFGILLWEIVSLGAIPYPGVETQDLLSFLRNGGRMGRPELCSDEMYSIMMTCWDETPNERPTFSDLRIAFEKFLTNESNYLELSSSDG